MNYKLKDGVRFLLDEEANTLIIYFGLSKWSLKNLPLDSFTMMKKKFFDYSIYKDFELFKFLLNEKLIIKIYKNEYIDNILEKNIIYFENILQPNKNPIKLQKSILNKHIMIVGVGGIGTVLLYGLKQMGIKHFVIIDFDKVSKNNLNRQLIFTQKDCGKYKVNIAKNFLQKINSDNDIKIYNEKIINANQLKNHALKNAINLMVCAADQPDNLHNMFNVVLSKTKIPFIYGGVGIYSGIWSSIIKNPYTQKLFNDIGTSNPISGSISPTNMIIGSMMLNEILKYFTLKNYKFNRNYRIIFNEYDIKSWKI